MALLKSWCVWERCRCEIFHDRGFDFVDVVRFVPVDLLHGCCQIVDVDVVERNVKRWQARCNALGLANRPHIKTHKLVGLAQYQLAQGAKGITVQKLGEAEVMVAGGADSFSRITYTGFARDRKSTRLNSSHT